MSFLITFTVKYLIVKTRQHWGSQPDTHFSWALLIFIFLCFCLLWNAFVQYIYVQVLCHVVPSLVKLRKEGLDGHEKIKSYMWVYLSILSIELISCFTLFSIFLCLKCVLTNLNWLNVHFVPHIADGGCHLALQFWKL